MSSKSEVDRCTDSRVIGLMKKECRQTDGQIDFQLYIVDDDTKSGQVTKPIIVVKMPCKLLYNIIGFLMKKIYLGLS